MKLSTTLIIIIVAFTTSLCGFIISMVLPQSNVSDTLMIASLFIAATSGIGASIFTKKLVKSKHWIYIVTGGIAILIGLILQIMRFDLLNEIFRVSGAVISIASLGHYVYLHYADFRSSNWIWFIPLILLGCLFKHMYWRGGNIIIFSSLMVLAISTIAQLLKLKKYSLVQTLLLIWQLVMCVCIAVFYFRYIKLDSFIIGYIFVWVALVHIFLQQEKNTLENSEFR
ncbi:MAG: hypothetical protein JNK61_04205 [Bacteroidia bacterium]|nr:hypothetical protein [Bacteroidia bacterium]